MKKVLPLLPFLFLSYFTFSQTNWQQYPYSPPASLLTFPKDDGKHASDKMLTEWWYINLHLVGSAPEYKKYDVMLCYFSKPVNMRIFNVAVPATGTFHTDVNQTPFTFHQEKGHWDLAYNIPFIINDYSYWTYPKDKVPFSYFFHAESPTYKDELNITATANRAPIAVGSDGFIPIGEKRDSSFYYTFSNMNITGSITYNGIKDEISSGIGWIDRQFGPFLVGINPDNKYEWFSLQVDKPGTTLGKPNTPAEFNVWQTYGADNIIPNTPDSRLVSGMYPDGSQDTCSTFIFERTGYWHDVANHKYYSQGWRYIDPLKDVTIDMTPTIDNQIINVNVFKFWEGGTDLKGVIGDKPMEGVGFAELVASNKKEIKCPSTPSNFTVSKENNQNVLNWSSSIAGTHPVSGYRIYRSTTIDGYWKYIASTNSLHYTDLPPSATTGYFYTISSFDDQTATSASKYALAEWAAPLDEKVNSQIRVYPSPTNEKAYIEVPDFNNTTAVIYNVDGHLMDKIKLTSPKTLINLNGYAAGVYFVQVKVGSDTETKKLVIE